MKARKFWETRNVDRISFNHFKSLPVRDTDMHTQACIRMFRGVIDQMVEDLVSTIRNKEDERYYDEAVDWFDQVIPEGFYEAPLRELCDLAEIPVDYLLEYANRVYIWTRIQ